VKFLIGDKEYEYDGKITVADAMFIHEKSGVGIAGLNRALLGDGTRAGDGNPHAIAAWCFLLKRRAGEAVRYDDMLQLDITNYHLVPDDVPAPTQKNATDKPVEDAVDPTSRNGKTRRAATARTS
jgi:hypothetical protein